MNKTNQTTSPTSSTNNTASKADTIKLGVDMHATFYYVTRQVDNGSPQPPQRFSPEAFVAWAARQKQISKEVYCCYEAGCFGYGLHRRLAKLGIQNFVVRPRSWDEYGKKVKTDKRDSRQLLNNLDRYLAGNNEAMQPVRVPSEQEERSRGRGRQRQRLKRELQRLQGMGVGTARYYGHPIQGEWWKPRRFKQLREQLPEFLIELLEAWQRLALAVSKELDRCTEKLEESSSQALPVGLGALTSVLLELEVCDWSRFKNRRQTASYTGLCPGEDSSGNRRFQGSINKHGNPTVRHLLIEAAWRLKIFQPQYRAVVKWNKRLAESPPTRAASKKATVALAREFAVDWWRVRTGRVDPKKLGLLMGKPCALKN